MKILVLGVTGMLGHVLFAELTQRKNFNVYATARASGDLSKWFQPDLTQKIIVGVDALHVDSIYDVIEVQKPDVVINCIGLIKQLPLENDPVSAISINALFPHQVAAACNRINARTIHISTDCVFSGRKGGYKEQDVPDANDLYGRTKYLGELNYSYCVTLRTSIIGLELKRKLGLIEWFLNQRGPVKGYIEAIYTGFTTIELARIIGDYVIPNQGLSGLYHVSSNSISKYDLLRIVAERYGKKIDIEPSRDVKVDRSLNSDLFRKIAGYQPPSWVEMIDKMYQHHKRSNYNDTRQ